MTNTPHRIHQIAAQHCEPLYLSTSFSDHNAEKANATITFIRYRGELYGVTCAHVYHQQCASRKLLTLHGQERYIWNLSTFSPLRSNGVTEGPDIAITYLDKTFEEIHFPRKNKSAIDLDTWSSPNWSEIKVPVAFGYPTEHKTRSSKYLQAPLLCVAAQVARTLSEHDNSFLLASSLSQGNTYYFSGMSGGPVYHVPDTESEPTLIGIVYEGTPGSSAEWEARGSEAFLTRSDIQIRAYTLTPEIFGQWLKLAGF